MELGVLMKLLTLFYHESENKKQVRSIQNIIIANAVEVTAILAFVGSQIILEEMDLI